MAAMEAEWLLDKKVEVGHAWGPTKWGGIFGFDPYWPIPIVSHSYIPISREKGQQIPIPIQAPEIPRNSSLNHVKSPSIPHNMVPIWSPQFWRHAFLGFWSPYGPHLQNSGPGTCTSATTTSRLGQAITRGDVEFAMDFWSWNPKEPEIAMDFSHHWDPLGM